VSDWNQLRELRSTGNKPALPIIITSKKYLPRRLPDTCMTIIHEAGTPMPVELLEGLDVIVWFDRCEIASAVWKLLKAKSVKCSCFRAWCTCGSMLTIAPMDCESHRRAIEWLGADA